MQAGVTYGLRRGKAAEEPAEGGVGACWGWFLCCHVCASAAAAAAIRPAGHLLSNTPPACHRSGASSPLSLACCNPGFVLRR